jgi:hypothetical protein
MISTILSYLFKLVATFLLRIALTTDVISFIRTEVITIQSIADNGSEHLSGWEKHKRVFEAIKSQYPVIKSYVINLAIELTVAQKRGI